MLSLLSPIISALTGGVINKIISGVVIAVIVIVAYSFWAMHQRDKGYQACKADILVAAQDHQNKVDETVNQVDSAINKLSDPASQLQQFWSQQ